MKRVTTLPPLGVRSLFQCPYCPRRTGVVAVDLDAARAGRYPPGLPGGYAHVVGGPVPPPVVFDPDLAAGRPCPHLVDFTVAGFANRAARGGGAPRRVSDFCVDWRSEAFDRGDPGGDAHRFLWEVVDDDGGDQGYRPSTPYVLRWVDRTFRSAGSRLYVDMGCCSFVAALHPEQFLRELLDGDRRMQAHYARERGDGAGG
jgi:hypothetical protein